MGLSVVYGIIQLHKGFINITSNFYSGEEGDIRENFDIKISQIGENFSFTVKVLIIFS